jgi:hypothetical protein
MAIGRISGSVLKSNLTRNGADLAFETNLLYLDVTNDRVGIGTSEPSTTLHVNGNTTITGDLSLSGSFAPGQLTLSGNTLSTNTSNADLELSANGTGSVVVKNDVRTQYTNPNYIIREYVLFGTTNNAVETEIFIGGVSSSRIPVVNNSTMNYTVDITARRTDTPGYSAGYQLKGVVDNNSGTVADVGDVMEVMVAEDDAALAVDIGANDTHNALYINVTGTAGATYKWIAAVKTYEVIE